MTILCIPMDSRPCNARFPKQIAAMAGAAMLTPRQMDDFITPADFAAQQRFLTEYANVAEGLVLSIDHWCFGSLLASRASDISEEEALRRMDWLERFLAAHRHLRATAYSVIMRSSISTLSQEDLPYYRLMTDYSQLWHKARLSGSAEDSAALAGVKRKLPAELLGRYHAVRARNHAVNLRAVAMTRAGLLDKLLLLQEDSQPYGFHKVEQQALSMAIRGEPRIFMHNGADEAGMLLTAEMACRGEKPLRLRVRYLHGDGSFCALLEDRPFKDNILSHSKAVGIELTEKDEDCVLCVSTPLADRQVEVGEGSPEQSVAEDAALIADEMNKGKPVALLDVRYMNGGCLALIHALGADQVRRLAGYAAWNTASNSLGTVLAQLRATGGQSSTAARIFTQERLLDDGLYQANVRQVLQNELLARGEDVYRLRDKAAAETRLRTLYGEAAEKDPVISRLGIKWEIHLPWNRTFETDIRIKTREGNIADGNV